MKIKTSIKKEIISNVGKPHYEHTLRVVNMAKKLAKAHGINTKEAETAAYFHDCAKLKNRSKLIELAEALKVPLTEDMKIAPQIIHGAVGASLAKKKYGVKDEEILNAIKYHTTGRKGMTPLEKVVFLADYMEEGRTFPGAIEVRKASFKSLDKGMSMALKNNIQHLLDIEKPIALDTIRAYNDIIGG